MLCFICLTLCDHMDCSPPGSSVHGILQARILEWLAISYYRGPPWPRDQTCFSVGLLMLFPPVFAFMTLRAFLKLRDFYLWCHAYNAGDVQPQGQKDPLEKAMATHSSILAWKIPCTEERGRPQSLGSQRVGHDWATSLPLFLSLSCYILDPLCYFFILLVHSLNRLIHMLTQMSISSQLIILVHDTLLIFWFV